MCALVGATDIGNYLATDPSFSRKVQLHIAHSRCATCSMKTNIIPSNATFPSNHGTK